MVNKDVYIRQTSYRRSTNFNKLCADAPAPVRCTLRSSSSPYTPYACGAQPALLPLAVGSMNIHDVRDRQTDRRRQTDVRHASFYNAPGLGIISFRMQHLDMPRPCTLHGAAQLQPIHALRL